MNKTLSALKKVIAKFLLTSLCFLSLSFSQISFANSVYPRMDNSDLTVNTEEDIIPDAIAAFDGMGIGEEGGSFAISFESVYTSLFILILVLLAIMVLLVFISANLVNLLRAREGEETYSFGGTISLTIRILKNRYVAIIGNFIIIMIGMTFLTQYARGVGLRPGYQPEQPIKYSHKLHAGDYKIDCQYCHSTASKSKNASIPSVNVCWNCHNTIKEGPKHGTTEIAKVEDHYLNKKPIEWVRIHNLQDHVYFSHQQHVVAGQVECETCHGPIKEMEEVYQFSNLSMSWCIECHRKTEVNLEMYSKMGIDLPEGTTVEDIGGTNCQRCHY